MRNQQQGYQQANQKAHQETGAIMIWLGAVLPIVLTLGAYIFNYSTQRNAAARVQSYANSAALAAAKSLCSTQSCFDRSALRNLAAEVLQINDSTLLIEPSPVVVPGNFNTTLEIERGWWIRDSDDQFFFESMEGDWQVRHPGIPAFMAANAIKVRITHLDSRGISFFGIGAGTKQVSVTATALADTINGANVAPYAVPVCALLDETGEFQPENVCHGDRFITRADRFVGNKTVYPISVSHSEAEVGVGPFVDGSAYRSFYGYSSKAEAEALRQSIFDGLQPDKTFGVKPNFSYMPCAEDQFKECNVGRKISAGYTADNQIYEDEYTTFGGWSNYSYENIADHFLVFGTRLDNAQPVEADLAALKLAIVDGEPNADSLVQGSQGDLYIEIGEDFQVNRGVDQEFLSEQQTLIAQLLAAPDPIEQIHNRRDKPWSIDLADLQGPIIYSANRLPGLMGFINFPNLAAVADLMPPLRPELTVAPSVIPSSSSLTNAYHHPSRYRSNDVMTADQQQAQLLRERNPTFLRDQYGSGLCQSARFALTCADGSDLTSDPESCSFNPLENQTHVTNAIGTGADRNNYQAYLGKTKEFAHKAINEQKLYPNVTVKVPVIADYRQNARACEGLVQNSNTVVGEQPLDLDNGAYIVIGFTDLNLFDYDFNAPKNGPLMATADSNYSASGQNLNVMTGTEPEINYADLVSDPVSLGSAYTESFSLPVTALAGVPRYNFNPWFKVEGQPASCNLIRSKISCSSNFIPSSNNHGQRQAILVGE